MDEKKNAESDELSFVPETADVDPAIRKKINFSRYSGKFLRFKDLMQIMYDRNLGLTDRMTCLSLALGILVGLFAVLTMLITGVDWRATLLTAILVLGTPIFIILFQRHSKYTLEMKHVSTVAVILSMPFLWLFSGAATAGGTLWMLFVIIFVCLSYNGKTLIVYLIFTTMVDSCTFLIGYLKPEWVIMLSSIDRMYVNIFLSLLAIGTSIAVGIILLKKVCRAEYQVSRNRAQELEKLKDDLEEKNKKLEHMNERQKKILSMMARELHNPLNGILGYNQMILQMPEVPEAIRGFVTGCYGNSQALLQILNDIQDYCEIDTRKLSISPRVYSAQALVSRSVGLFRVPAHEKGLRLILNVSDEVPPYLIGDDMRIQQLLTNLISNAIKYTKQGAITVSMDATNVKKGVSLDLVLRVKDTGQGISPEAQNVLFIPFTQLREADNKYIQGTGLGLTLIKNIVNLMNGTIKIDSQLEIGTIFTITLPQKCATKQEAKDAGILDTPIGFAPGAPNGMPPVGSGSMHSAPAGGAAVNDMPMNGAPVGGMAMNNAPTGDSPTGSAPMNHAPAGGSPMTGTAMNHAPKGEAMSDGTAPDKPGSEAAFAPSGNGMPPMGEAMSNGAAPVFTAPGKRILCVDDMKMNRNLFCLLLKSSGITIDTAEDGETALDMVQSAPYDLIFVDQVMPGISGVEVLQTIRSMQKNPEFINVSTPVIVFTSNAFSTENQNALLKQGFDGILEKPIRSDMLISFLRKYLH